MTVPPQPAACIGQRRAPGELCAGPQEAEKAAGAGWTAPALLALDPKRQDLGSDDGLSRCK